MVPLKKSLEMNLKKKKRTQTRDLLMLKFNNF